MNKLKPILALSLLGLSGCAMLGAETDSGMTFGKALLAGAAMGAGASDPTAGAAGAAMAASATSSGSSYNTSSSGRIAPRQENCLRVEREEAWGSTTFLSNSCAMDLDVRFCFGKQSSGCHTNISSTSVPAYDRKTIFYDRHDGYDRWLSSTTPVTLQTMPASTHSTVTPRIFGRSHPASSVARTGRLRPVPSQHGSILYVSRLG